MKGRNEAFPDTFDRAYQQVLKEQDSFLKGVKPGKTEWLPAVSLEEAQTTFRRLVANDPARVERLALIGVRRDGLEETAENVDRYSRTLLEKLGVN